MPTVVVKWNGAAYPVDLPADATVGTLRAELKRLTGVPRDGQKLAGVLALTTAADRDPLFALPRLKDGQRLMLIGTADRVGAAPIPRPPVPPPPDGAPTAATPPAPSETLGARHLTRQTPMLAGRFANAAKTKVLSLNDLLIKTLADDVFSCVPDLITLDLSHNVLSAVCPGIGALRQLRHLNLSRNQIADLSCLVALHSLETLDCSQNLVSSVPEGLLGPKIRELRLAANHLGSLPDNMFDACATTLRVVDLSGNRLRALPPSLFRVNALQDLDLDRNALEGFGDPDSVRGLPQLKRLSLQHNGIRSLPDALFETTNLMELNLDGNPFKWDQAQRMPSYEKWVARLEQSMQKKYSLR